MTSAPFSMRISSNDRSAGTGEPFARLLEFDLERHVAILRCGLGEQLVVQVARVPAALAPPASTASTKPAGPHT